MSTSKYLRSFVLLTILILFTHQAHSAPTASNAPGYFVSLVNTLQHWKMASQSSWSKWRKESFQDKETPEVSEKRNRVWQQIMATRFN